MRALIGIVFIDFRGITEALITLLLFGAFVAVSGAESFGTTLDEGTRSTLYVSLAGTATALLGFVLTALAILAALPSSDRMRELKDHPKWNRVPSAYIRASQALLLTVVLCTLGVALDSDATPWKLWEFVSVAAVGLALARVATSLAALDLILHVAQADETGPPNGITIDDPGP